MHHLQQTGEPVSHLSMAESGLDHPLATGLEPGGTVLTDEVKALLSDVGKELAGEHEYEQEHQPGHEAGHDLMRTTSTVPVRVRVVRGQSSVMSEARLRAERAARRRAEGEIRLKKVREGVGGVKLSLTMNERAAASLCTLRFPAIETGIFLLRRVGSRIIGDKATYALMGRVVELITQLESTVAHTEAAMIERLNQVPEAEATLYYREALIANDITVYSPEARRLAYAIKGVDGALCHLRILEWQGSLNPDEEKQFTEEVKAIVQSLSQFLRDTLSRIENTAPGDATAYAQ